MKTSFLLVFLLVTFVLVGSCSGDKKAWVENLSAAEKKEFVSGNIPEERIENLKKGVSFYSRDVERTIKSSKQTGIYYRMLALEYMSLEMYNEALKNIEKAVEYFPTSPMLFYYGAVSSAQMSKAVFDNERASEYLETAEQYYLRAIALDPVYNEALYGISVLYIFEMNKPFAAEPFLERLIARSRTNYDAMFMLARVRILKGETDKAIELYSSIEENAKDDAVRAKAKENRMKVVGGYTNG